MTTFDTREKAYEDKFVNDAQRQFEAVSRANKQFGLWAAECLGLTGYEAETYSHDMCKTAISNGYDDVLSEV
jgi:hypothetical protein